MSIYVPLDEYFADSLPEEFPQWGEDALEGVAMAPVEFPSPDPEIEEGFGYEDPITTEILFNEELALGIPGLDAFELLLAPGGGGTLITMEIDTDPIGLRLVDVPVALRLDETLLRPAEKVESDDPEKPDTYEAIPDAPPVEITLAEVTLEMDVEGNIDINLESSIDVPLVMIGDTGVVIEAADIELYLGDDSPSGEPDSWRGITLSSAGLYLPGELGGAVGDLTLEDAAIGNGGFSGTISSTWDPILDGELFEIEFGVSAAEITLVQNTFTECEIEGALTLPFFDEAVDVDLGVEQSGGVTIAAASEDGLYTLEKDFLEFEMSTLELDTTRTVPAVTMGGTVDLDVSESIDAAEIPPIEVEAITVDADGNVDIDGGWLDLDDQYALELGPAELEIAKLGFGQTDTGGKWLGLNGEVRLLEGIPAGASVDGLRVVWDEPGDPGVSVSLDGVGIEFEVPNTLGFKGEVAFGEDEFRGSIDLDLIALDMTLDAELIFGTYTEEVAGETQSFRYMGVQINATLPSGIPLWATGLALYGFGALFANRMEPDRSEEQEWYAVSGNPSESWFHESPTGVMELAKWRPAEDGMGFGGSVPVGTVADNGLSVATDVTLVISFPGPVIMLQGRAELLEEGADVDEDAPYQAVVIVDNNAGSLTVGVDARYDKSPLLDISASAEAYYSFDDPEAWYLNLGVKDPREDRIRAEALSIFTAESYFMLDPHRLAMGVWSGYEKSWSFGPLSVGFAAYVESDVRVNFHPPHFYGTVQFNGEAALRAFGVGASAMIHAGVEADVFTPMHLRGQFEVAMDLPWPLPDPSASVSLEWGPQPELPEPPEPLEETGIGHELLASTWEGDRLDQVGPYTDVGDIPSPSDAPTGDEPVVPLDSRPEVTFTRPVINESGVGGNPSPPSPPEELIGDPATNEGPADVSYELTDLNLLAWDEENNEWKDTGELDGTWAPVPEQGSDGSGEGSDRLTQTKLQVATRTPYYYTRHTGGAWDDAIDRHYPHYPCPTERNCYGFEGRTMAEFEKEIQYVGEEVLYRYQRTTHAQEPWARFYQVVRGDNTPPISITQTSGPSGNRDALCMFDRESLSKRNETYQNEFQAHLPESHRSIRVHIRAHILPSSGTVTAQNEAGENPDPETWELDPGQERNIVFTAVDGEFPSLTFEFNGSLAIVEVCDGSTDLTEATPEIENSVEETRSQLARWSEEAEVLDPYTDYRLEVITRTHLTGRGELSSVDEVSAQADYIAFRTEGPPGISTPDRPSNDVETGDADTGDETAPETGLETLSRYVEQTTPPTVPAKGEQPPMPQPVYRTAPVGVDFKTDYVDVLYQLASRDLGVYLFDTNDDPVRDEEGQIVVPADPWGTTENLLLDRATRRWFQRLDASSCVDLDEVEVLQTKRIETEKGEYVLQPNTVYEARLRPRLFVESWESESAGTWETTDQTGSGAWDVIGHEGHSGSDAEWLTNSRIRFDDASFLSFLEPHRDAITFGDTAFSIVGVDMSAEEITIDGDATDTVGEPSYTVPARKELQQTDDASDTIYTLTENSDLAIADEQPQSWSDTRIQAVLGTESTSGSMGLVFRWDTGTGYRIDIQAAGTCRLTRLIDGEIEKTWEASTEYEPGQDHTLTVEAIGEELQVLIDQDSIIHVIDTDGPEAGEVGIAAREMPLRCSELRVDDFRDGAPTAYRFSFTTSRFVDAPHKFQSFQDETWTGSLDTERLPDSSEMAAPNDDPTSDEHRLYRSILRDVPESTRQSDCIDVTKLQDGDTTTGLFVQSPEPIEWEQMDLSIERGPQSGIRPLSPKQLKLTGFDHTDGSVSAMLRESGTLEDVAIEYRRGTSPGFEPTPWGRTFMDLFDDPGAVSSYTHIDASAETTWSVDRGRLMVESPDGWSFAIRGGQPHAQGVVTTTVVPSETGRVGVVFRFRHPNDYYRLDVSTDEIRLINHTGTDEELLWSGPNHATGETIRIQLTTAGETITGVIDDVPVFVRPDPTPTRMGNVGIAVEGTGSTEALAFASDAAESVLLEDSITDPDLEAWSFVKEPPYTTQNMEWEFTDGELQEHSNVYGFVGGPYAAPGTYGTIGDRNWTDYRVTAGLRSDDVGAVGAIGVIVRYQDDGSYYRFSMDSVREYRRLVRIDGGKAEVLWADDTGYDVGEEYLVTIECVGDRIIGYLDGKKLFDITDGAITTGCVGVYCRTNEGARFSSLRVVAPQDSWLTYHEFKDTGTIAAGTRFEIHDEATQEPSDLPRVLRSSRNGLPVTVPRDTVQLRVINKGTPAHMRPFTPEESYEPVTDATVIRSADKTGFLLTRGEELLAGQYRLTFTSTEDNDGPETPTTIDIPWKTI